MADEAKRDFIDTGVAVRGACGAVHGQVAVDPETVDIGCCEANCGSIGRDGEGGAGSGRGIHFGGGGD